MKFEEIISSLIMVIVTGLVLVGFTIAWYSNVHMPAVTGMEVKAVEVGSVKVALAPASEGGVDISELEGDAKYAELGMAEFTNVAEADKGELAPGVYGQVTFYVTPINSAVRSCSIVPMVRITQDGSTWYPVIESLDGDSGETTEGSENNDGMGDASDSETGNSSDNNDIDAVSTLEELHAIAQEHIEFFSDVAMTQRVTADAPYKLTWDGTDVMTEGTEKTAVLYWKWHYEYPFSDEEASLSDGEKNALIRGYDEEDMKLGNNVTDMKFYFTFSAQ